MKLNIDDGDLVTCDRSNLNSLWTAPWSPGLYSRGIHVIKVQVEDEFGEMHVTRHVFSVDGITRNSEFPNIGQLILSLDMIAIFQVLKYCPQGTRGAKGAPLPGLCFAHLALICLIAPIYSKKCYVTDAQTHGRTDTHTHKYLNRCQNTCLNKVSN